MKHLCPIPGPKKPGEYEKLKAKVKKVPLEGVILKPIQKICPYFVFLFFVVVVGKEERRPAIDTPVGTTSRWQVQHSKLFRIFLNVEYF